MRHFRRKSMSRQMFLSILAITGFVLAVFFAVSIHLLGQSYMREEAATIREKLAKCSRIADLSLEYMDQSARMLSTDSGIISAAVAPDHSRLDRSISVINLLSGIARTNDLISRAVLYISFDHSVYTSDGAETHISEEKELDRLIREYSLQDPSGDRSVVFGLDQMEYVMQDLPVSGRKRIGTIILQIDKARLYQEIQDTGDGNVIVALDRDGNVFLSDPELPDQIVEKLQGDEAGAKDRIDLYTSHSSGLTFYNLKQEKTGISSMVARFAPLYLIVILLGVFVIAYSVFASRAAYRPIQSLIETVAAGETSIGKDPQQVSEIDYLRELIDRTLADRESLMSTTAVLIPEIERRLLTDLVADPSSAKHVREYLQGMNSRFAQDGVFGVMAMEVTQGESRDVLREGNGEWLAETSKIIKEWDNDVCHARLLPVEEGQYLLLFMAGPGMNREILRSDMKDLLIQIRECISSLGGYVRAGMGSCCRSLGEIAVSYREARDMLTDNMQKVRMPRTQAVSAARIRKSLDLCTSLLLEQKAEEAEREAKDLCAEIRKMNLTQNERRSATVLYTEEIRRQYRLYGLNGIVLMENTGDLTPEDTQEQMYRCAMDYLTAMTECCRRKSSRQVVHAKRYIQEHYQDGMLSLEEVAQEIGIKPTYLSTLFTSDTGKRFSEFLREYRVEMAKDYLLSSELPIKEISARCGFNSVQSFNRVFRQVVGKSPGEYRH